MSRGSKSSAKSVCAEMTQSATGNSPVRAFHNVATGKNCLRRNQTSQDRDEAAKDSRDSDV